MLREVRHFAALIFVFIAAMGLNVSVTKAPGSVANGAARLTEIEAVFSTSKSYADQLAEKKKTKRVKNSEAREARRRAKMSKRLTPVHKTELPADCPYDSFASFANDGDVYSCEGLHYRSVQEGDAKGFDGHAQDVQSGEIQRAREIRDKALKQVEEATKRQQKKELSNDCVFDAFASTTDKGEVYSCAERQYRRSGKNGETGYQVLNP